MPTGSILVADDDAAIRTVLNQALSRAGYEVRSTGNAATLWRWVSQGDGDLVITDVVMPDENAFDLIPRIRKARPDLPIIVRARDTAHAAELYRDGASHAVPETLESSLQLSEAVLVDLGVAMGPVIASIHEKRDELRKKLKDDSADADPSPFRSLRRRRPVG
jgi:DNA-binding NtrC family response regulator